jgi:hypothetical protein
MPLAASAIAVNTTETAPALLWREWLEGYFDGKTHSVGGLTNITFPLAAITFGQGPPSAQPLAGLEIRVLQTAGSQVQYRILNGWENRARAAFLFLVLGSPARAGSGDVQYQVRHGAELLYALLNHAPDRYVLAQKGITHLRPLRPDLVPGVDYAARQVRCDTVLRW